MATMSTPTRLPRRRGKKPSIRLLRERALRIASPSCLHNTRKGILPLDIRPTGGAESLKNAIQRPDWLGRPFSDSLFCGIFLACAASHIVVSRGMLTYHDGAHKKRIKSV